MRLQRFCSRGPVCVQPLTYLCNPLFPLALLDACPSLYAPPEAHQIRKAVFDPESTSSFCTLLRHLHLSTELINHSRETESCCKAVRKSRLPCQSYRLLAFANGLIRIAQQPQRPPCTDEAMYPRYLSIQQDM